MRRYPEQGYLLFLNSLPFLPKPTYTLPIVYVKNETFQKRKIHLHGFGKSLA